MELLAVLLALRWFHSKNKRKHNLTQFPLTRSKMQPDLLVAVPEMLQVSESDMRFGSWDDFRLILGWIISHQHHQSSLRQRLHQQQQQAVIYSTLSTRGCGRWGAARYWAFLAVEYGQTEGTAVAMVTRSPGAREREFLMTPAKYVTYIRESTKQHLEIPIIRLTLTQLLCPVTLTFDLLTLKLVHGVLVSRGPFLPSLVFVDLFVFPLGGGTGQTDRRTGSTHDGASF